MRRFYKGPVLEVNFPAWTGSHAGRVAWAGSLAGRVAWAHSMQGAAGVPGEHPQPCCSASLPACLPWATLHPCALLHRLQRGPVRAGDVPQHQHPGVAPLYHLKRAGCASWTRSRMQGCSLETQPHAGMPAALGRRPAGPLDQGLVRTRLLPVICAPALSLA